MQTLNYLIANMAPILDEQAYLFATVPAGTELPAELKPRMQFVEAEGITLIIDESAAQTHGIEGAYPCRCITLRVHSELAAVGFLAAVCSRLAAASISTNAVAGYYHDHLFVPANRAQDALQILKYMAQQASA